MANLIWRKSKRSGPYSDNCVEVATTDNSVAVRDSKNPNGAKLVFSNEAWTNFILGIKNSEFDV